MRKILSIALAVVMLAAMFVMPTNAAEELGLVITEINVDTAYTGKDGSSFREGTDDVFEFVEVYNASSQPINLYDYSLAYTDKTDIDKYDGTAKFTNFTPIADPVTMQKLGVKSGSICTSAKNVELGNDIFYPVNPASAIVYPGEVAIIWLYTTEAYTVAALMGDHKYGTGVKATSKTGTELTKFSEGGVPVEFFKDYYGIEEEVTFVAVDANAASTFEVKLNNINGNIITGVSAYGEAAANYMSKDAARFEGPNGANNAKNDLFADKYPSADGRFQLDNDDTVTIGLVKSEKFEAADALKNVTLADAEANATYSYDKKNPAVVDIANNFIYNNGKVADAYDANIATPGSLLIGQAKALATVAYVPVCATVAEFDVSDTLYEKNAEVNEKLYSQDFESFDVTKLVHDKVFANTQDMYNRVSIIEENGNKVLKISNGQIMRPVFFELVSAEDMLKDNGNNMYSNYVLSYDIKVIAPYYYSGKIGLNATDAYAGVIYNYDGKNSFDMFAITNGGYGLNVNRHKGATAEVDVDSAYYAAGKDTDGQISIINRITNGKILSSYQGAGTYAADTNPIASRMYEDINDYVNVTVYFDWEKGSSVYVNGAKVSEATDASNNVWALAKGNFGLGIYAYPTATVQIDNIKMYSVADETMAEVYLNAMNYGQYEGGEPATGDATLYVVVAMAVAFVALAAVVVIKRKKVND